MTSSNDIELDSENASYYFKFLPWDTDFFGKRSYLLEPDRSRLAPSPVIAEKIASSFENCFITAKIDASASKDIQYFLQEAGFRYIDTEVTLRYRDAPAATDIQDGRIEIVKLATNGGLPYEELGGVYSLTRFHCDPHISTAKANALWTEYIRNYHPSPERHLFVARYNGDVAGAMLVNTSAGDKAFLFFVAVLERFQGHRIGSLLLRHIISQFTGSEIRTGTQIRNIRALNFYIRNGFSIMDATRTVLHRWE